VAQGFDVREPGDEPPEPDTVDRGVCEITYTTSAKGFDL
jgi:hypothetical protein